MPRSPTIRRATSADSEALARVRMLSWQTAYRGLFPDALLDNMDVASSAERFRQRLDTTGATPEELSNVARDHLCVYEGEVVGWSSWGPTRDESPNKAETAELYALYVLPERFGLGIGYALMTEVLREIDASGIYHTVTLWVLDTNVRGIEFYTRQGFAPDGATKVCSLGPDFEAIEVRYRKALRVM